MDLKPFILVLAAATSLIAADKVYKATSDYEKEPRSYLLDKLDTYGQMVKRPAGTKCDWVFVSPAFNLDDLRRNPVAFIQTGQVNETAEALEASLRALGVNLQSPRAVSAAAPALPQQMGLSPEQVATNTRWAQAQAYKAYPALLDLHVEEQLKKRTSLDEQIEKDRYEEDKAKLGVEPAAKNAEARQLARREEVRKKLLSGEIIALPTSVPGTTPAVATPSPAVDPNTPPEARPGYTVVFFVLEKSQNVATEVLFGVGSNTMTSEVILLKDGKALLAGRHTSASAFSYGNGSAGKCGQALATAFLAKP